MPELLTRVEPLLQALQRASRLSTNFFASHEQILNWSERGTLYWMEASDCLLIFRRSGDFYHSYHIAGSIEALGDALKLSTLPTGVLVADLVSRETEIGPVARAYGAAGFRLHKTLFRMFRIVEVPLQDSAELSDVTFAEAGDVTAIRNFLVQLLDRFADQIPEEDELQEAVVRRNILIVRRNESLGGLLIFKKTGLTITLRYWYVKPEIRQQGIGAQLMKSLFRIGREARRIVLWVDADNRDSIEKYRHYGFQTEPLVDQIMTRKNRILEVLQELRPEFDFTASDDFIGDGMLDSHDVVTLVADLDRIYGISIAGIDIVPEKFANIAALEQLLRKYGAEP